MPNGMSEQKMLDRIYTELVGLDGTSGMVKEHKDLQEACKIMTATMVTKTDCAATRKQTGDRKDKMLMRLKDVLLAVLAIAGFLWGSGVLRGGR